MEDLPMVLPIELIEDEALASQILQKMQEVRQLCCYGLSLSESDLILHTAKDKSVKLLYSLLCFFNFFSFLLVTECQLTKKTRAENMSKKNKN